jgi:hypothetical protein
MIQSMRPSGGEVLFAAMIGTALALIVACGLIGIGEYMNRHSQPKIQKSMNTVYFNDDGTLSMLMDKHMVTISTGSLTMESKGWIVKAEKK